MLQEMKVTSKLKLKPERKVHKEQKTDNNKLSGKLALQDSGDHV